MSLQGPFAVSGVTNTYALSVTATSSNFTVTFPAGLTPTTMSVENTGSNPVFITWGWGSSPVAAVAPTVGTPANGFPIQQQPAGRSISIGGPTLGQTTFWVSAIALVAGPAVVYFTFGEGF